MTATAVGPDLLLAWPLDVSAVGYDIWSAAVPYFAAGDGDATQLAANWAWRTYADAGELGDAGDNHFYRVLLRDACGRTAVSEVVGAFEFLLIPGE